DWSSDVCSSDLFASKDTVRSTAVCSLYIAPKDKMKDYYIFDKQLLENTLSHHKYDGAYYSSIYYTKDSLDLAKKITIESVVDNGYLFAENAMRDYEIGRASCRERGQVSVGVVLVKDNEIVVDV